MDSIVVEKMKTVIKVVSITCINLILFLSVMYFATNLTALLAKPDVPIDVKDTKANNIDHNPKISNPKYFITYL